MISPNMNTLITAKSFIFITMMFVSPEQQEIIHLFAATSAYQDLKIFRKQLSIFESFSKYIEYAYFLCHH
jgi:hypothetical protein